MTHLGFTIAAVGDLHCTKGSAAAVQALFAQLDPGADVVALCGDLTDYGLPEEAQVLARELASLKTPTRNCPPAERIRRRARVVSRNECAGPCLCSPVSFDLI